MPFLETTFGILGASGGPVRACGHVACIPRSYLLAYCTPVRNIRYGIEITKQLETAHVILPLVSPEFIASEHCYRIEMQQAIEKHERGEARVIPIILRPCLWLITPLGKLQALPKDAKPVIGPGWRNQGEAFFDVAKGIHRVVEEMTS